MTALANPPASAPNFRLATQKQLVRLTHAVIQKERLGQEYTDRLDFEFSEIEKQGAWLYWLDLFNNQKRFDSNPNYLVLPWLLRMLVTKDGDTYRQLRASEWREMDPIVSRKDEMLTTSHYRVVTAAAERHGGKLPVDIQLDPDKPDIDLDCLPEARNVLKAYAMETYRVDSADPHVQQMGCVCSVGTWQTYKFRSALIDVYKARGNDDKNFILGLTTNLPDWVDDLPDDGFSVCKGFDQATNQECKTRHDRICCPKCGSEDRENPTRELVLTVSDEMISFVEKRPMMVDEAIGLIGRIRNMGMHAGAIIIADRPLYGNLPLIRRSDKSDKHKIKKTALERQGQEQEQEENEDIQWISAWTEGRNTQLSKFGYIKWDILGLKTLKYRSTACDLIRKNSKGKIHFGENNVGFEFADPHAEVEGSHLPGYCGWYMDHGVKRFIPLNERLALNLADRSLTDGIFQFDTPLAKEILRHGVKNFYDLLLYNAMGHPGPMDSIPDAVANRDGKNLGWEKELERQHPAFLEVLRDTYGVLVFQEQLAAIWQLVGGFTSTESQEARKAVAKKWMHLLKPIRQKWIDGASPRIGEEAAIKWWDEKMAPFGRYAFNKSHAVAYCLMAYDCLWLKAHFPTEFWASILSYCHPDKLVRYVGIAKYESQLGGEIKPVVFGPLNIDDLTVSFTVDDNSINQGLIGVKGLGIKTATIMEAASQEVARMGGGRFPSAGEFLIQMGRKMTEVTQRTIDLGDKQIRPSKQAMERLIKLGSFSHLPGHENRRALWFWFLYYYFKGDDSKSDLDPINKEAVKMKRLRQLVDDHVMVKAGWKRWENTGLPEVDWLGVNWNARAEWSRKTEEERIARIAEYRRLYKGKRQHVPAKLDKWRPEILPTLQDFAELFDDYSDAEKLDMERRYVGYYLSNPMKRFKHHGLTIKRVKEGETVAIEGIIASCEEGKTKARKDPRTGKEVEGKCMWRVRVNDGTDEILVFVWDDEGGEDGPYRGMLLDAAQRLTRQGKKDGHEMGVRMAVKYDEKRKSASLLSYKKYNRPGNSVMMKLAEV